MAYDEGLAERSREVLHDLAGVNERKMLGGVLAEVADGTEFTWLMHGPNSFMSKLMSLFFNMDRMFGAQFEQGLASLKALAENRQCALERIGERSRA